MPNSSGGMRSSVRRLDLLGRARSRTASGPLGRAGAASLTAAVTVLAWVVLSKVLPHGAPAGILLNGAILGAINGLIALSIVLVYRANRFLNFAAADIGGVAAVLAIELHIKVHLNYFLCMATGLVAAALIGVVVEVIILRRFAKAPRLILSVVTLAVADVLNGLSQLIPADWKSGPPSGPFNTPFSFHFGLYPVRFSGNYLAAIVAVPVLLGALSWFFRYTSFGVAIRASADNGDRAQLLGMPVNWLSTLVWAMTGVLSALAVLLRTPILGFSSFSGVTSSGGPLLLQTFTAAVIAGMTSMPLAMVAAVYLGVLDQLGAWTFQNSDLSDAMLLVVILLALLIRRDRLTRSAETGISTWQLIKQVRPIPPELNAFWQVRLGSSGVRLAMIALAVSLPFWIGPAHTQLASVILLYAIIAASLAVLTGWAGHISLGHVAFMGFGAATAGTLISVHGWGFFPALGAATVVAGLAAVILGLPALRITGDFLAVVTLAFAVTASNYFLIPRYFGWFVPQNPVNRSPLFGRIAIGTDAQFYFVCLVALAMVLVAVRSVRYSHVGRAMIAAKDNRLATRSFSINTTRLHLIAFAASGALAGLAGGLFVVLEQGFSFGSFDYSYGINFFLMVVIGGLGSVPGAVLGAIYVYGVQYLAPSNGWSFLATGFGVLVVLWIFPGGLGELVFRARDWMLRGFAHRHGLLVPSLVADTRQTGFTASKAESPLEPVDLVDGPLVSTSPGPQPQPLPVEVDAMVGISVGGGEAL